MYYTHILRPFWPLLSQTSSDFLKNQMETLTLSAKDCTFRSFQFQFQQNQFQGQVQCQQNLTPENRRTPNTSTEGEAKMAEGSPDQVCAKTKLRVSDSKKDKNVNKDKSEQHHDNNDSDEKPKKKKKWKKLQPSEIGFNISLFPRPVRDNSEFNVDADALWTKIENECETVEKIIEPYQNLIELEGNTSRDKRYIRVDRDRKVIKAHKQVKTKYCRSVLNNRGRKAIYVNHRVYKMMDLDIQRLCYMPSPKKAKNILKRDITRGKDNYSTNPSTNKPHQPTHRTFRPAPVQCLAHTIHKDNLPSDIDTALANLLMDLQHRELTPEDYDMLLRLDEARVKPKTMSVDKLSAFKTETVESNDELEVCPICMDLYEKGQIKKYLPCQHAFHVDCIDSWLKNSSMNCPIDNLPITS